MLHVGKKTKIMLFLFCFQLPESNVLQIENTKAKKREKRNPRQGRMSQVPFSVCHFCSSDRDKLGTRSQLYWVLTAGEKEGIPEDRIQ